MLIKREFFSIYFRKHTKKIQSHENGLSGSRVVSRGRTDGHDEANSRFSQLCTPAHRQVWTHCVFTGAYACAILSCPAQSLCLTVRLASGGGNDSTAIDHEPLIAIRITPKAVSCSSFNDDLTLQQPFWKCVIPVVCVSTGKGMQSNTTLSIKMFNDYIRQLHVSAPTGHLQVVFKRT